MDLKLDPSIGESYKSKAQRSRVITESWAAQNLYCLNCGAGAIEAHRPGKKVEDYFCPDCDRRTQLKAKRGSHGRSVANSAYGAKMEAIQQNAAPDYAFLSFDADAWLVTDLFVVPGHFMTPNVVEKRKPLSSNARRSGWVGSTIILDRVPEAGRIPLVQAGSAVPPMEARRAFERTLFLTTKQPDARGWLSAVMDCIDDLEVATGDTFELGEVYQFEDRLSKMYPDNQHIRAKIRQQLQVLRDEGVIEFLGRGEYRLEL